MSDCFDYGVKTTLPIVCLFDTASNAFLTSTSGKVVFANSFDSALRDQFQEFRNTLSNLLRPKGGNIETNQELVLVNQLLDLLGRNRVVNVLGPEENYTSERSDQFEALAPHFAGCRFQDNIHSSSFSRFPNLFWPGLLAVVDDSVGAQTFYQIELLLGTCQSNDLLYTHDLRELYKI
jgi:hypothetical protein